MGTPIEPVPKVVEAVRTKERWAVTSTINVPALELDQSLCFADVLLSRRTRRVCEPMKLRDALSLIQFVMYSRQIGEGDNLGRLRKISLSAGALHPVEVLVVAGPEVCEPILYCDTHNAFGTVQFHSPVVANTALQSLSEIVPQAVGHCLLFVANQRHVAQAYEQPRSLLWRDAGALLQTFSLLATALDCAFVPLGSTGSAILDALIAPHEDYLAVGTGIIGKVPSHIDASSP